MGAVILMPALSPTMTEGKLARWLKKAGDKVKSGEVIAEIETDKATMEVEAVDEGVLTSILVPEGTENVAVNTAIAELDGGTGGAKAAPVAAPAPVAAAPAPASVPAAPRAATPEKDWGPTKSMTVREALRDAMAAEMRADADVFLIGEVFFTAVCCSNPLPTTSITCPVAIQQMIIHPVSRMQPMSFCNITHYRSGIHSAMIVHIAFFV